MLVQSRVTKVLQHAHTILDIDLQCSVTFFLRSIRSLSQLVALVERVLGIQA